MASYDFRKNAHKVPARSCGQAFGGMFTWSCTGHIAHSQDAPICRSVWGACALPMLKRAPSLEGMRKGSDDTIPGPPHTAPAASGVHRLLLWPKPSSFSALGRVFATA